MTLRGMSWLAEAVGVDPMMRKEFYGMSRRWQTYFSRALYVALLGILVWIMWKNLGRYMTYSAYSEFGREIFVGFGFLQYFLIALGAVGMTSDMISKEVRGQTLGILAITPLSPWRMVYSKWKSAIAYISIILLSGVPILSLGIYFGGVGAGDLLPVMVLILSTAMMCGAFGLLCSTLSRKAYVNQVLAVVGLIAYGFLPILLVWLCDEVWNLDRDFRSLDGDNILNISCWVSPVYSLFAVLIDRPFRGGPSLLEHSWISASPVSIGLALLLLRWAARRVNKLVTAEPRPSYLKQMFERLDRFFERSPLGIKIWPDRLGVWDANPFLWKEMRSRIAGKFRYFTRISVALLIPFCLIVMLMVQNGLDPGEIGIGYCILMMLLFLGCIGTGSGAFTSEKEDKKWDVLLTTPMRSEQVLWAKLVGSMLPLGHLVIMFFLFTWAILYATPSHYSLTPVVIATLIFCFFIISVGLLFSLAVQTTRKAYALTLTVALFFLLVIPVLGFVLDVFSSHRQSDSFMLATNPFAYLGRMRYYGYPYRGSFPDGLYVFVGIYLTLAVGCLAYCRLRFDSLAGRGGSVEDQVRKIEA